MLESIIGAVASGGAMNVFGAISGLIGGWLAKREQRKLVELVNVHEECMGEIDIRKDALAYKQALLLADKELAQTESEGRIADDLKSADAFLESVKHSTSGGGKLGGALKSAVRPTITAVLLWCTWEIYTELNILVGGLRGLDAELLQELFIYVVHAIIFLTITATAWWFASRGDKAVKAINGMINR
ncbi:MAG: hypothetical protein GY820_10465 [Gammaproteobacteria bacterium]|nr:hypothetical protein [Gammaproteobacteria bacterium]